MPRLQDSMRQDNMGYESIRKSNQFSGHQAQIRLIYKNIDYDYINNPMVNADIKPSSDRRVKHYQPHEHQMEH